MCSHRVCAILRMYGMEHARGMCMRKSSVEFNLMQMTVEQIIEHAAICVAAPHMSHVKQRIRNMRCVSMCIHCVACARVICVGNNKWEAIHWNCHSIKCHTSDRMVPVIHQLEKWNSAIFVILFAHYDNVPNHTHTHGPSACAGLYKNSQRVHGVCRVCVCVAVVYLRHTLQKFTIDFRSCTIVERRRQLVMCELCAVLCVARAFFRYCLISSFRVHHLNRTLEHGSFTFLLRIHFYGSQLQHE